MNVPVSIALNILAIANIAVIIISSRQLSRKDPQRQQILTIAIAILAFVVFDMIYVLLYGNELAAYQIVAKVAKSCYFILNSLIVFLWVEYIGEKVWDNAFQHKWYHRLYRFNVIINCFLVLSNFFFFTLFDISSKGLFVVNYPFMYIFTGLNYLSIIVASVSLLRHRNLVGKAFFVPILLFQLPPLLAELVPFIIGRNISLASIYSISGINLFYISLRTLIYRDELTGLYNRVNMNEKLNIWFNSKTNYQVCGIMADIDNMKRTNDLYGHPFGDELIKNAANILGSLQNERFSVIRYGGDEFLVLWNTRRNAQIEVDNILEIIEKKTAEANDILPNSQKVHFSIGAYYCDCNNCTQDEFLQKLDIQLYNRKTEIDRVIEEAIKNNHFEVYYQPIYSLSTQSFPTAEALLRLKNSPYGLYRISSIIEAAEKNGDINAISDFVLNQVCSFISSPTFEQLHIKRISVNLSLSQCLQENLVEHLVSIIDSYHIDHSKIYFEILETAVSLTQEKIAKNLAKLREQNIYIAIDDFGKGYSNFHRLLTLPFKYIKLDKDLIDASVIDSVDVILKQLVSILHSAHCEIIAEGVETEELVQKVKAWDCDYIQGFYYSVPLPLDAFVDFIKERNHEN